MKMYLSVLIICINIFKNIAGNSGGEPSKSNKGKRPLEGNSGQNNSPPNEFRQPMMVPSGAANPNPNHQNEFDWLSKMLREIDEKNKNQPMQSMNKFDEYNGKFVGRISNTSAGAGIIGEGSHGNTFKKPKFTQPLSQYKRPKVIIYTDPITVKTDAASFKGLVQKLTGKDSNVAEMHGQNIENMGHQQEHQQFIHPSMEAAAAQKSHQVHQVGSQNIEEMQSLPEKNTMFHYGSEFDGNQQNAFATANYPYNLFKQEYEQNLGQFSEIGGGSSHGVHHQMHQINPFDFGDHFHLPHYVGQQHQMNEFQRKYEELNAILGIIIANLREKRNENNQLGSQLDGIFKELASVNEEEEVKKLRESKNKLLQRKMELQNEILVLEDKKSKIEHQIRQMA